MPKACIWLVAVLYTLAFDFSTKAKPKIEKISHIFIFLFVYFFDFCGQVHNYLWIKHLPLWAIYRVSKSIWLSVYYIFISMFYYFLLQLSYAYAKIIQFIIIAVYFVNGYSKQFICILWTLILSTFRQMLAWKRWEFPKKFSIRPSGDKLGIGLIGSRVPPGEIGPFGKKIPLRDYFHGV